MQKAQDDEGGRLHTINRDIGRVRDQKLARAFHPATRRNFREVRQARDSGRDGIAEAYCRCRIAFRNVCKLTFTIASRFGQPFDPHAFLPCARAINSARC